MYNQYKTEYSNQVHQLIVSVSRHFYVTLNGKFKYQKNPFNVKLNTEKVFTKKHIVHYIIRDHFSGLFYTELTDIENMFSVSDFLYRAWVRKEYHPLHGIPRGLTIPKPVQLKWPKIVNFIEGMGIEKIDVTSGFQGGIRDIRTWEEYLRTDFYESGYPPDYSEVRKRYPETCMMLNTYPKKSKKAIWEGALPSEVYIPSSFESFTIEDSH